MLAPVPVILFRKMDSPRKNKEGTASTVDTALDVTAPREMAMGRMRLTSILSPGILLPQPLSADRHRRVAFHWTVTCTKPSVEVFTPAECPHGVHFHLK